MDIVQDGSGRPGYRLGPILDRQLGHRAEVAIHRDHGTVPDGPADRCDHHVILTDQATDTTQLDGYPTVLECDLFGHEPELPGRQGLTEPLEIAIPVRTSFGAVRKLGY